MRKVVLHILCFMFFGQYLFAQEYPLAVIVDGDGYVNVRNRALNKIGRLSAGEIVFISDTNREWYNIEHSNGEDGDEILNGFIHKTRLLSVSSYMEIPPVSDSANEIVLQKDSIKVRLTGTKFVLGNRSISKLPDSEVIEKIDDRPVWGEDGGIPKTEYKSIEITIADKHLFLPKEAYLNTYNPALFNTKVYYDSNNKYLYICSLNSDGAGGYLVLWLIQNGQYRRRYIYRGF